MKENHAWSEYCKSLAPAIVEASAKVPVSSGPGALIKALEQALPDWKFRHAMSRGGWYRLGGIITANGERISDNLERWVETQLDERDGDIAHLIDDFAGQTLYATRLVGQTHYLVSHSGAGHADFLQLEIEDLQEIRAHRLFANDPTSVEDLIDPRTGNEHPLPVNLPHYAYRRIQHIGSFLQRMRAQRPEPDAIHRMIDDWSASSAGISSTFSNQWVVATREHLDRYHQPVFRAQPIATLAGTPPEFEAPPGTSGLALNEALTYFDREIGYPMAWYFHMLGTKAVPHWVAQVVIEDTMAGFAYLPQRDVDVVRNWLHRPYAL